MLFIRVCVLLVLVGCAENIPDPTPEPPRLSAWSEVIELGQAQQADAPALMVSTDTVTTTWVGEDEGDIFPYMRVISDTQDTTQTLPLPPAYPHRQQLIPAQNGSHLFWLDAHYTNPAGNRYLWTALVDSLAQTERGQVRVSNLHTESYSVLPQANGEALVVWSGGRLDEPLLYVQRIDSQGRPTFPVELTNDVLHPALLTMPDGTIRVFWLHASDNQVMTGIMRDEQLHTIEPLMSSVSLAAGDRLPPFFAGPDGTVTYLIWNITRADGTHESWFAATDPQSGDWSAPSLMGIALYNIPFETGFNGGEALSAIAGDTPLHWATPVSNAIVDPLPLVAQVDDRLMMIYMTHGMIVGYQSVVVLDHDLIGSPMLAIDRNRHLYISWSEPLTSQSASLNLTATRPIPKNRLSVVVEDDP